MRFSRLYLANWRNFAHVDVALEERMFLIGANATGKSNLLDAFRFLRDIVRIGGGFEKAILDRGGVSSLCSFFAHDHPDIVIDVHIANGKQEVWRYFLAITQDTQHRPLLQAEKVWRSGALLLDRPVAQDAIDDRLLRQTHLEQINSKREFREIADFFNSITYYHIVPHLVREPERSVGRISDPYGSDFIEQIANLPKRTQEARLRRIQSVLRTAIPQLAELKITKDRARVPHLLGKFSDQDAEGLWHTEADFSDGTLRLIGLLWTLLDGTGPLLLEEPELSLHQEVVRQIPSIMWSLQKEHARQTLVSTHSYDLLRNEGIGADEFVARRLLEHVGLVVGTVYGLNGKADILMRLSGYNQAARFTPWFVLVDWITTNHVQAIESWMLADAESLAAFLAISSSKVSPNPDLDPQPKRTLINLARTSRRKAIREDMVPRQGSSLTVGPHYADRLIEFTKNYWQPDEAVKRSESLRRCVYALSSLTSWDI